MSDDFLANRLVIYIEKDIANQFSSYVIMDEFESLKGRQVQFSQIATILVFISFVVVFFCAIQYSTVVFFLYNMPLPHFWYNLFLLNQVYIL